MSRVVPAPLFAMSIAKVRSLVGSACSVLGQVHQLTEHLPVQQGDNVPGELCQALCGDHSICAAACFPQGWGNLRGLLSSPHPVTIPISFCWQW
jgi:hypothetical protein